MTMRLALWLAALVVAACVSPLAAPAFAPGGQPASEWERVVQAARREGKVVVAGPVGADRRDALTKRGTVSPSTSEESGPKRFYRA